MPSEPEKERKVTQKRKKNNIASLQEGTDKTSESVEVGNSEQWLPFSAVGNLLVNCQLTGY